MDVHATNVNRGFMRRVLSCCMSALVFASASVCAKQQEVDVAIISFAPYAAWYIVQDKDLLKDAKLNVRIIESIAGKNAALETGEVQCMNNTVDSIGLARAAGIHLKLVMLPDMSYGLDRMIAKKDIHSVKDFPGKTYGADYGFLNQMWMLLTLKRAGIPYDKVHLVSGLPQDSAAAFVSGALDIDVNYLPFAAQDLKRPGAHILKTSRTDRTWQRGLIGDGLACSEKWLKDNPKLATKLIGAWFEAVNWWKEHPLEGDKIVAKGLGWPVSAVRLNMHGDIELNLRQNIGAFEKGHGGVSLCGHLPDGAPPPPKGKGWGELFKDGKDCVTGYEDATWNLFNKVYREAGVAHAKAPARDAVDSTFLNQLEAQGYLKKIDSNKWIGRIGLGKKSSGN